MTDDWAAWHDRYDAPDGRLARRLAFVQGRIREALDGMPAGPIRVVSACAGQGRDLLPVLADHPRAADVTARLVELDERNVALARQNACVGVQVVQADAAECVSYAGAVPAHLVLMCGVFGNIVDADVRHTIENLPRLCAPGATVVWTRHMNEPNLTPQIRKWFGDNGFTEIGFDTEEGAMFSVGAHRLTGPTMPFRPELRLFDFIGYARLATS